MIKTFFDSDKILAVFTDRHGGVSKPPFDSLNIGFHVEDDSRSVEENRGILKDKLGIKKLSWMDQIHSDSIKVIDKEGEYDKTDALITRQPELALMVMIADCIPALLFDEGNNIVAVAHAGREGVFKNIIGKTVLMMKEEFNSNPSNIKVSLGPSIRSCCYEVGNEIIQEAKNKFGEKYIKNDKSLDLIGIATDQLLKSGVIRDNIETIDKCTCCNKDYFSHRRDGETGRFAGIIMIK